MTEDKKLDRRAFLRRAAQLGAVAAVAPALVSMTTACSKKDGGSSGGKDSFSCEDTSGLTDDEKANRNALEYTDHSPHGTEKDCENCALYVEAEAGHDCGGCQLIAGPIHPRGYCTSWVAK